MNNKPLKDIIVIEFASVLAGPLTGSFLAELGAKVIKIENKNTQGDVTRSWRNSNEKNNGTSAYYASANTFKQVEYLDLTNSLDKTTAINYVKDAHIVICNFKPNSANKLGLSFEQLAAINPSVIYADLIGFANQKDRVAYDVVLQAETGFMSMNGQPGNEPTKIPVAIIDILAAHQLKEGILLALLQQSQKKEAIKVSVNLEQAAISALANQASNWLMNNQIATQIGSLHPNIAPYGETFLCSDNRYVVLAIGSNKQFEELCKLLDLTELSNDSRFITNQKRVENRTVLATLLSTYFNNKTSSWLQETCLQQNIPMGIVKSMNQVFETKAGNDMIIEEMIDGTPTKKVKNVAFNLSGL